MSLNRFKRSAKGRGGSRQRAKKGSNKGGKEARKEARRRERQSRRFEVKFSKSIVISISARADKADWGLQLPDETRLSSGGEV